MQTRQPNLEGTGEVRLRRLVKEALRMRPERIIVGEVRQEECLDLLIALNSGVLVMHMPRLVESDRLAKGKSFALEHPCLTGAAAKPSDSRLRGKPRGNRGFESLGTAHRSTRFRVANRVA
jgi:hypothetical protein